MALSAITTSQPDFLSCNGGENLIVRCSLLASLLLIASVSAFASQTKQNPVDREVVIKALRKCTEQTAASNCEMAAEGIRLFRQGDKALLDPLLDLGLKSNGSLADLLGNFFAEDLLWKNPRMFLEALSSRDENQQRELSFLAAAPGMPKAMLREVRENLSRIGKNKKDPLAPVARLSLLMVEDATLGRNLKHK